MYKKTALIFKQGLVQDYTQRLIKGNIYRQKLSRLRPHRLGWAKGYGLRLDRLSLYGSETGVGVVGRGGSSEIIYSSISRKNPSKSSN